MCYVLCLLPDYIRFAQQALQDEDNRCSACLHESTHKLAMEVVVCVCVFVYCVFVCLCIVYMCCMLAWMLVVYQMMVFCGVMVF